MQRLQSFLSGALASVLVLALVQSIPNANSQANANVGAAAQNMIAVTTGTGQRLYLVDTNKQAVMVYDTTNGGRGFSLVGGRTYKADREAVDNSELKFNANGYSIRDVQSILQRRNNAQPAPHP